MKAILKLISFYLHALTALITNIVNVMRADLGYLLKAGYYMYLELKLKKSPEKRQLCQSKFISKRVTPVAQSVAFLTLAIQGFRLPLEHLDFDDKNNISNGQVM